MSTLAAGAEEAGDRQGQPERHAIVDDEDGGDIAADQRIGALADIDAADVEGEPDAGAGDARAARPRSACSRGPDGRVAAMHQRDRRRATDREEDRTPTSFVTASSLSPRACPSARCGRMARKTMSAAKITR